MKMNSQCDAHIANKRSEFPGPYQCSRRAVVREGAHCYCSQHATQRGIILKTEMVHEGEQIDVVTGKPWQWTH